mmetsp:Transcript_51038/g.111264  ORF Transcript_51038/g.111264 Transcript_51038/m.111264 type:complete len:223 (+) Transcript_51038:891-1559(+)
MRISSVSISFLRPVTGSLMVVSRRLISSLRPLISLVFSVTMPLCFVLSSLHHCSCSTSAFSSFVMTSSILPISVITTLNGFSAWSRAWILAMRGDDATFGARKAVTALMDSGAWTWRWTLLVCRNFAPVEVALTPPKVAKAASLLRMETASAMAASSLVRSMTRCLYSSAFFSHMSVSWARNSSASAFASTAVESCVFLVERSPSLLPSFPCLRVCESFISL